MKHINFTVAICLIFLFCGVFCAGYVFKRSAGMAYGSANKKECPKDDYSLDLKPDFVIVKSAEKIDSVKYGELSRKERLKIIKITQEQFITKILYEFEGKIKERTLTKQKL